VGGRIQNSIELAKASLRVLRDDKRLMLLPLFSGVATLVVAASFAIPALIVAHGTNGFSAKPVDWLLAAVGYLVLTYITVFFNAALVYAADRRLHGETISTGEALHAASARAHVLLPWVIISATVSIVLRAVEQRGGIVGRIIGGIAGVAWSVVTFLVLPVLVVEGIGPIAAVKRSGELFRRTWGENLVANAGIGLVTMLAAIVGAIPLLLLVVAGGPISIFGGVALAVWLIFVALVGMTLTGILQTALYRFATGDPVAAFDQAQLGQMFRSRRGDGGRRGFGFGAPGGFAG
jgi:hypothetical protein